MSSLPSSCYVILLQLLITAVAFVNNATIYSNEMKTDKGSHVIREKQSVKTIFENDKNQIVSPVIQEITTVELPRTEKRVVSPMAMSPMTEETTVSPVTEVPKPSPVMEDATSSPVTVESTSSSVTAEPTSSSVTEESTSPSVTAELTSSPVTE